MFSFKALLITHVFIVHGVHILLKVVQNNQNLTRYTLQSIISNYESNDILTFTLW